MKVFFFADVLVHITQVCPECASVCDDSACVCVCVCESASFAQLPAALMVPPDKPVLQRVSE